jgi:hypothetical protein
LAEGSTGSTCFLIQKSAIVRSEAAFARTVVGIGVHGEVFALIVL